MDLEFLICQYLDGSLQGEAREDMETRLAMDANARELLAAHRRIDEVFAEEGLSRDAVSAKLESEINWDLLASRISVSVADTPFGEPLEIEEPQPLRAAPVRRHSSPALSYRGFSFRALGQLAIAASLLLAMGTVAKFYFARSRQPTALSQRHESVATLSQVSGPQVESAADGVAEVTVGPGKSLANSSMIIDAADDLVSRPSHVVIASGVNPDQDRTGLPY